MNFKNKIIISELEFLHKEGLLDEQSLANINKAIEENSKRAKPARFFISLNLLAVFFLALAAVLLARYNWYYLDTFWRALLSLLPSGIFAIFGAYTLARKADSRLFCDISVILGFGAAAALLVGFNATFQPNAENFLAYYVLMTLPLMFVFRSLISSLLSALAFIFFIEDFNICIGFQQFCYMLFVPIVFAGIFYFGFLNSSGESFFSVLARYIVIIFLPFLSTGLCCETAEDPFEGIMVLVSILAAFSYGTFLLKRQNTFLENGYFLGGMVVIFITMLLYTFGYNRFHPGFFDKDLGCVYTYFVFPYIVIFIIFNAVYYAYYFWRSRDLVLISPLPMLVAFLIWGFWGDACGNMGMYVANFSVVFFGLFVLFKGFLKRRPGMLNMGLIMLVVYAIFRNFNTDVSVFVRALWLGGIGLFALIVNLVYHRKAMRS